MKNQVINYIIPKSTNILNLHIEKRFISENFENHFHDFYEIEFILSGKCVHYINGVPFESGPDSIIFLTPTDMHSVVITEPITALNLAFDATCIDSDIQAFCNANMYSHYIPNTYVNLLYEEFNTEFKHNLLLQKYLLNCLLIQISRYSEKTDIPLNTDNLSIKIAKYLKTHYKESITMSKLSKTFGYTPNYISNQFHKNIGKTVKQFIIDIRLEQSAKSLLTTSYSVTEICYNNGFSSLSNFLRSFKSKYGTTPTLYRKKLMIQ